MKATIMSHSTFDATLDSADVMPDATSRPGAGIGASLRTYLESMREGIAASRRYEILRGRGLSHEQAITRAFAETGVST